jgi:hypothetical protein
VQQYPKAVVPDADESIVMTDEARIRELLEEILESGRTPEEVCAESPELLPQVRKRWRQIRRVEYELDVLFPSSAEENSGAPQPSDQDTERPPQINGDGVSRLPGRVTKWVRLRQATAVFIVLLLVLLGTIIAACLWLRH